MHVCCQHVLGVQPFVVVVSVRSITPYVQPGPRWCRVVSPRPRFAPIRYGWIHTYLLHLSLLGFLHERTMVEHGGGGPCLRTNTNADAPSCTLPSDPCASRQSPGQADPSSPPPQLHPMQLHPRWSTWHRRRLELTAKFTIWGRSKREARFHSVGFRVPFVCSIGRTRHQGQLQVLLPW